MKLILQIVEDILHVSVYYLRDLQMGQLLAWYLRDSAGEKEKESELLTNKNIKYVKK